MTFSPKPRRLSKEERNLIRFMLKDCPKCAKIISKLPDYEVSNLDDGGMGSIRVLNDGPRPSGTKYGETASEMTFADSDGTPISVAIFLDKSGEFFELDIWRVDFGPVHRFPHPENICDDKS